MLQSEAGTTCAWIKIFPKVVAEERRGLRLINFDESKELHAKKKDIKKAVLLFQRDGL